jgi:hypothetical protein
MKKIMFVLAMLSLGTLCWAGRREKMPPTGWITPPQ